MGKTRKTFGIGVAAALAVLGLAACGDEKETNTPAAAPSPAASDALKIEIQSAVVPEFASTARPTVNFRVLDGSGNPVDLEAELATTTFPNFASPGRAPSFTLAMLDDNNDYVSYYSTTTAPKAYTYIPDPETLPSTSEADVKAKFPPAPRTQSQAIAVTRANLRSLGNRVYQFTFPAPTTPTAGLDRTKPHKIAGWAVRRPNAADQDVGTADFNFVPAGSAPPRALETVNDGAQSCGRCHGFVQAHGTRRGVQFCITCHSPQTGDPETNQTVNFKVMIHRIHSGETLPSVQRGTPYYIVGFQQGVTDWSDVAFPWHDHGVRHCTVCHDGKDADNWKTRPTLNTCTSCHDNVKFTSGTGLPTCPVSTNGGQGTLGFTADCAHLGGPITVDNPSSTASCIGCHGPGTAASIDKYHHGD
jgi:OmcA/MtrC family decaheme c-type cytochrome